MDKKEKICSTCKYFNCDEFDINTPCHECMFEMDYPNTNWVKKDES